VSHFSNFPQIISQNAKILVAPLDWGLGHATRCIPLIRQLRKDFSAQITIAATGSQAAIIRESFPDIPFLTPPEYGVQYHKNRAVTIARLVFAMPGILQTIREEANWLDDLLSHQDFDAIISDNRYGLSSSTTPSYLITHQLLVKTAFGDSVNHIVQRRLYKLINRFSECWVPDFEKEPSLAGELSHPALMPSIPVRYLGPLSRLHELPPGRSTQLLVLLSGPEPQRTLLENIVIRQWKAHPGESMVLVRGLPLEKENLPAIPNAQVFNHLGTVELSQEVANAHCILCRSGYSSIMDLIPLKKKCIMVPTPGQTEQEYLARWLASQGRITAIDQDKLQLSALLRGVEKQEFFRR
jgi:hypothetical protein